MLGNILIIITLIFYGCLFNLLLKPMPGGDYGVGYSFAYFIYVAGFIISSGLLAWNMNLNHCFDWIPASFLRYRNWLVFLGWLSFVVAIIWSLEYNSKKVENEFPQFMSWFTWSRIYIWLPLLMLIPALYLINVQRLAGFAPLWVKIPIQTGFSVSFLIALVILGTFGAFWVQGRIKMIASKSNWITERLSDYKAELEYINNYKEPTIEGLLKYVDLDDQRENAAIAKIKSYKNWENDLIEILAKKDLEKIYVYEDNTRYVYAFLDGNKIEHPEKFIQSILSSLKVLNIRVRKSLDDPYDLELGLTDIEVVCRVLETQFKDRATEFRPSLLKLQQALEMVPPERKNKDHIKSYNKEVKKYRLAVKNWLESNK